MRTSKMLLLAIALGLGLSSTAQAQINPADFSRMHKMHNDMMVFWTINNDEIKLGVEAKATGWAAFGIGDSGGMMGADIVYYEAESNSLKDAYSIAYEAPKQDTCQSWTLVSGGKNSTHTYFTATRKLDPADPQDHKIWVDAPHPRNPHKVLAAWGDSATMSYHTDKRTTGTIRFHGAAPEDPVAAIRADTTNYKHIDFLHGGGSGVDVPKAETYYHKECQTVASFTGVTNPESAKHMVAAEPVIHPDTAAHVHHFILYGCTSCDGSECDAETRTVIWTWAPGYPAQAFPDVAGVRILGGSVEAFELETHFDNPSGVTGKRDYSGVKIYYTETLRQHDVGILQVGDPAVYLSGSRIEKGITRQSFDCPGMTDSFTDDEVNVFYRGMHMHQTGTKMVVTVSKEGEEDRTESIEYYDFRMAGAHNPMSTEAGWKLKKGSEFKVDCYFKHNLDNLVWGLASSEEMCIDFLYYWPKQEMSGRTVLGDTQSCYLRWGGGTFVGDKKLLDETELNRQFGVCDCDKNPCSPQIAAKGMGWSEATPTTSSALHLSPFFSLMLALLAQLALVL